MSLNESIVEDAMRMVKSEIGGVKFRNLSPFPISLFTLHSFFLATLRDTLLPKLLSGELSVADTLSKSL